MDDDEKLAFQIKDLLDKSDAADIQIYQYDKKKGEIRWVDICDYEHVYYSKEVESKV